MKHVRRYAPDLDVEAVKLRLDVATQRRIYDREAVTDLRVDVISLLAEIKRLMRIERDHRREFADLLGATRDALAATDAGDRFALLGLRSEVDRQREITAEELAEWRGWSDLLTPRHETTNPDSDPD